MKPLSCLLLFILPWLPAHGAFNTDGLPVGAAVVAGFDLAAFYSTQLGQAVLKAGPMNTGNSADAKSAKDKLGIDTQKDIHAVVLGVYPGSDGRIAEKNLRGVILVRGSFDPARINRTAQEAKVPSVKAGKHQAWEARAFFDAVFGPRPKSDGNEAYLVVASADLIVIASKDFLDEALDAQDKNTRAELLPKEARAKFDAVPKGWMYLYGDTTRVKMKDDAAGITALTLVLGESATDLRLSIAGDFISPEKAAVLRKQAKGLQAFAMIGLMSDEGKSPEEKEGMQTLSEVIQKIRVGGEANRTTLDLEYPADKSAQAIVRAIIRAQKTKAAPPAAK
jgi:hypothetical protein